MTTPFHISIATNDINIAREFYADKLGCRVTRRDKTWIDFDFFGHQLTVQLSPKNIVEHDSDWQGEQKFPVRHFGVVLIQKDWDKLKERIITNNIPWLIIPTKFFEGKINEQVAFFIKDPSGHAVEFKTFGINHDRLFKQLEND